MHSPADPQNQRGNMANYHDGLQQIPVSSAVCLLLTVLIVSRTVIQLFTYDLVTHVLSWYTQTVKM